MHDIDILVSFSSVPDVEEHIVLDFLEFQCEKNGVELKMFANEQMKLAMKHVENHMELHEKMASISSLLFEEGFKIDMMAASLPHKKTIVNSDGSELDSWESALIKRNSLYRKQSFILGSWVRFN